MKMEFSVVFLDTSIASDDAKFSKTLVFDFVVDDAPRGGN